MARTLTKKQKGFVKDYVKTGNGFISAKNNYDKTTDSAARVIASENLTKPNIIKAIADRLPDDLLEQRHLELLNKREKIFTEGGEEIDLGPDTQAVSKGLDMAYKIKGSYAPEKQDIGSSDGSIRTIIIQKANVNSNNKSPTETDRGVGVLGN